MELEAIAEEETGSPERSQQDADTISTPTDMDMRGATGGGGDVGGLMLLYVLG